MKALAELGISPAPWEIGAEYTHGVLCTVTDADGYCLDVGNFKPLKSPYEWQAAATANARLITLAPKMYKAIYDEILSRCRACTTAWARQDKSGNFVVEECSDHECPTWQLIKLLGEAGDEEDHNEQTEVKVER